MDYQGGVAGSLVPAMPSLSPTPTTANNCTLQCNIAEHENLACNFNIEVGSIYEIDHIYLPPRTPVQLKAMRVVMVSEKTPLNVAVRFPSMESLQQYFCNSIREMYPALDEKFVMGTALADKVLLRQVSSQEFAEKKHLESFWWVNSASVHHHHHCYEDDSTSSKGVCLSELKVNGMVRWGVRRQVRFLRKHEDKNIKNTKSPSSIINEEEKVPPATYADKEDEDEEENEEEEEEDEEDIKVEVPENDTNLKRKRYSLRHTPIRKAKKVKREKQKRKNNNTKMRNKCKLLVQYKNPKNRWSEERYKMAEKNLLEVMQGKKATANNPILRPELRAEARKRIGDTGLLDHLLKHMAGKVAPGGNERFRRRHNADGAMEYWLESADLVNVRKEAGVSDPYWIPPLGWKPGDCLTPEPISAHEFNFLKDEISTLKREIQDLQVKIKQQETPQNLVSNEMDPEISPVALKQIGNFVHTMEEKEKIFSTLAESNAAYNEKRQVEEAEQRRKKELEERAKAGQEKAAKIERLKSGFRICKPQGTFLWPNSNSSNISSSKATVQVEDLLMVPTPPSVSSSSAPSVHLLPNNYYTSSPVSPPIKPVPERLAPIKITLSSVSNACTNTALINLNDDPFNNKERPCGIPSSRHTITSPTTDIMPNIFPPSAATLMTESSSKGNISSPGSNGPTKPPSITKEGGTWLALATPNTPATDEHCQG
ncbi:hypothetical protein DM860_010859 [Cuscuta australis]|uniref:PTC1-like winged helix-turn-helix domain-containing protein n=1 Tax=Cuscuta australis TaxID=267555 RepID=A0A328E088_9ASTE|nr:hypothetical protein DM860_010859 [Cuscuta australis]